MATNITKKENAIKYFKDYVEHLKVFGRDYISLDINEANYNEMLHNFCVIMAKENLERFSGRLWDKNKTRLRIFNIFRDIDYPFLNSIQK